MTTMNIDEFTERFGKWTKELRVAQRKGAISCATQGVSWIKTTLINSTSPKPFDIGTFRNSWTMSPMENGAIVYNPAPHAVLINEGVRAENVKPGPAMRAALAEWAIRKGIATAEDATGIAWAIALSLKKKGIFTDKQYRFTQRAVEEFFKIQLPKHIAREIQKVKL